MRLDHIGIVVRDLSEGIRLWTGIFGYRQATEPVFNTRQRVRVVFLEREGCVSIKLVEPAEPGSPVASLAARGGGLHHLCFRTAGPLEAAAAALQRQGGRVLAPPQPGEAFEGHEIAFVYAGQGLNVELVATDARARRIPRV
jgi:methylmalonyl-CoA/ethylmalonyl-CoA epimerase